MQPESSMLGYGAAARAASHPGGCLAAARRDRRQDEATVLFAQHGAVACLMLRTSLFALATLSVVTCTADTPESTGSAKQEVVNPGPRRHPGHAG